MTTHLQLDIHDWVEELTRTHAHREPYVRKDGGVTWTAGHVTSVPPLVLQLIGAAPAGSGDQTGATPHSKPAARIEALDTVMLIDDEAGRWFARLGENQPPGDRLDPRTQRPVPGTGTIARVTRLHALHASAPRCSRTHGRRDDAGAWCCLAHRLEHDVRRWWQQARIVTGWDSPAYRPHATCPVCEHRGGLRINLGMRAGMCVECRSLWSPEEIGLLAEHIRTENHELHLDQTGAPSFDASA